MASYPASLDPRLHHSGSGETCLHVVYETTFPTDFGDNSSPEVAGDVISGKIVEKSAMDMCVKFGASTSIVFKILVPLTSLHTTTNYEWRRGTTRPVM